VPTLQEDLMTRLTALVEQYGNRWKKIAPIIAAEGYRDRRGEPYSDNYLRKRMKGCSTDSEASEARCSEPAKLSEQPHPDIHDLARTIIALLKQEGVLQEAVKEMLGRQECTSRESRHEMPPQPERVTDRRWEKLAGTCDCELVKLFHQQRRELRLSVSQMLDYVLWNFLGKPRLSFQSKGSASSEESGEETHVRASSEIV
jgi:hypothetical protein